MGQQEQKEQQQKQQKKKQEKQEKKQPSLVSVILKWAGQKKGLYTGSILLAVISVLTRVLPYFEVGKIINGLISGEKDKSFYLRSLLLILVFFLISEICHTISTSFSHQATFEVIRNLRKAMLEKLTRIPLGRVLERGTGSLKNTMMERLDSIETTLAHLLPEFTSNIAAPVFIFICLLRIDVRMAFIALIPTGLGIVSALGLFSGYGSSYQKVLDTTKTLNDTSLEYVRGIEVIKAFSRTEGSYRKFVRAAKENAASYLAWMKRCAFYQAATMTLIPYTILTVLPFGAWFVYRGSLSLGDFIMCVILSLGLLSPLITLGSYTDDLAASGTIVSEIEEILAEPETDHPAVTKQEPRDNGVTLKHVSFSYQDTEVLHDISLSFAPGTVNAVVGPSGSGKSTIARLIAGFWDVDSGEIDFGGVNMKDISQKDLRKRVAYVSQDNYLFNETVRENIRQGRPEATDAEVEEIAKKSGCYDFIMGLEQGFDTVVGSSGGHLSGGERQRISIARAMLKDAPVVILDEATAYTDPENEAVVEQAIARLVKGKTLIMIAHRLYTIQTADWIFLIQNGKLEAAGTQEELLQSSDLYRQMWQTHVAGRDGDGERSGQE